MASRKKRRLDAAVAAIQKRWGPKALHRGGYALTTAEVPHIPTGFPSLDRALGIGGLPKGRVSELVGPPTSGKTTLAFKFLSQAQADGRQVGYVDQARSFDPDYAHRCGMDLSRLLIGSPLDLWEALEMMESLVRSSDLSALVLDSLEVVWADPDAAQLMAALLGRLTPVLARSGTALLFLRASSATTSPALSALAHYAAVRLKVMRERWLRRQSDIQGYEAQVEVQKNRLGPAGRTVTISIEFNGTVRGNGL